MTMLNGELVFAVTFKNGDVVFVSDTGDLLLVHLGSGSGGQGSNGSSGGEREREDENEHEGDDD